MIFARTYLFCVFLSVLSVVQLHSMSDQTFGLNCAVNFQCNNQTHDDVEIECTVRSVPKSHYASCSALNSFNLLVIATPLIVTGAVAYDILSRKASCLSCCTKRLISAGLPIIGACTVLFTAASLYTYENYVSNNEMTRPLVGYGIAIGNVLIAELLKR
jgi:hypothetical protein